MIQLFQNNLLASLILVMSPPLGNHYATYLWNYAY